MAIDKNAQRGLAAYQRWKQDDAAQQDDWLERLVQNDAASDSIKPAEPPPSLKKISRPAVPKPPDTSESKYRRVAKFLMLIGSDEAAKVLANLDESQVEEISREIATIRGIGADEAAGILEEFHSLLSGAYHYGGAAQGGVDEARRLLYAAFGPEKGETMLRRSVPQTDEGLFGFLEDFSGEQIMTLLRDESPAAVAMILSRVNPKLSASVLSFADEQWRKDAVLRIGRLGRIAPEVLEKTAESLREKARHIGSTTTTNLDGMGALAAILKHTDISFGDKILNELAESDEDLSRNIKERLFTLDDVVKAEDRPIQEKLRNMDVKDIAVLIKGRPVNFSEKILSNVSANRREEIRLEGNVLGPIPKKDAEKAIKEFMDWFRAAREKGAILMLGDELIE